MRNVGRQCHAATVNAGTVLNATVVSVAGTQFGGVNGATAFFIYVSIADSDIGCNSGNLTAFAVDSATPAVAPCLLWP